MISQSSSVSETTIVPANYTLSIAIVVLGLILFFLSPWAGVAIELFGLFLVVQTASIRLEFTDKTLIVSRSGKEIRNFPYSEWQSWEIFWSPLPILFYFKEVNSIHFIPMLFDRATLLAALNQHVPKNPSA
jgi:hypothetical protein